MTRRARYVDGATDAKTGQTMSGAASSLVEQEIDRVLDKFVANEKIAVAAPEDRRLLERGQKGAPEVAAVGTIAAEALAREGFRGQVSRALGAGARLRAYEDLESLAKSPSWALALVLSPHKREVAGMCDELAPTAAETGVVDTLVCIPGRVLGLNTNTYAAESALGQLLGAGSPKRALLAGTGATARSVLVAIRRLLPTTWVGVAGRSREKAARLAGEFGSADVVDDPRAAGADLIINSTTVGQRDDRDRIEFDLEGGFAPGVRFFDLTNRLSSLQAAAIAAGCVVASGVFMQRVTDGLRMGLLAGAPELEAASQPAATIANGSGGES